MPWPRDYWQDRHSQAEFWQAGGDRGLGDRANFALYHLRFGLLLRLLMNHMGTSRRERLLDAGCGRGWLTGHLRQVGYRVTGIDQSPAAVEQAKWTYGDPFIPASLAQYQPDAPYDAVLAVDVLYHIVDDAEWEASLRNLTGMLKPPWGLFIFSECFRPTQPPTEAIPDHLLFRGRAAYAVRLKRLGFQILAEEPYGPLSEASFYVCKKA